jgi:hypothetical protein
MPLTVTIAAEPSGSVVARGGDSLAQNLLDHAGFAFANDWYGPRHRLPTSMAREEQAAVASHAAEMLRAARYTVDLDPALDRTQAAPAARSLDDHLLQLIDQIRGARSGGELGETVGRLLHPEHGVLERVREALEAASEQVTDLDDEAHQLADRFAVAAEFVTAAEGELLGAGRELAQIRTPLPYRPGVREAAVAASPATQAGAVRAAASATTRPPASACVPGPQTGPRAR